MILDDARSLTDISLNLGKWLNGTPLLIVLASLKSQEKIRRSEGADSGVTEPAEKVAKYTLDVMKETVPPTMAGITFLSGGQSEEEATQHIQCMAEYMPDAPWNVSFSFARALQSSVLKTWGGKKENEKKAQDMLRAVCQVRMTPRCHSEFRLR